MLGSPLSSPLTQQPPVFAQHLIPNLAPSRPSERVSHVSLSQIELSTVYREGTSCVGESGLILPQLEYNGATSTGGSSLSTSFSISPKLSDENYIDENCIDTDLLENPNDSTEWWQFSDDILYTSPAQRDLAASIPAPQCLQSSPPRHQKLNHYEENENRNRDTVRSSECTISLGGSRKRKYTTAMRRVDTAVKYLNTSDLSSDPCRELPELEDNEFFTLRSKEQIQKIVSRGVKRARKAAEEVSKRRKFDEPNDHTSPIKRPSTLTTIHGKRSRCEALKLLTTEDHLKPLRGSVRCRIDCDESFTSLFSLAEHLDNNHELSSRPFECPFPTCPWSIIGFIHYNECNRHIKSTHCTQKLVCELCQGTGKLKQFARTDALRRHVACSHTQKNCQQS